MEKTKFWAGVALCGQSAILLTSSLSTWKKGSNLAKACLLLSAASGVAGAYLLKEHCKEKQIALEKRYASETEECECACDAESSEITAETENKEEKTE